MISRYRRERLVESGGVGTASMMPNRRRVVAGAGRCGDNQTMPVLSPHRIVLTDGQRRLLLARARRASGEHRDVLRARIVLAAAGGAPNAAIARDLGVTVDTVRKWRRRFCEHGLDGLRDRSRPGRPRRFAATVVAEVKALACELPADSGHAAGALVVPGVGCRGSRARHRHIGVGVDGAPLAGRRRAQTVAAPLVDLPARPRLRRQSRPRARSLRARVRRRTTGRERLRAQRR